MSKLRNLLNYLKDNAIAVDGKYIEIDIASYEDELEQLQQAHRAGWEQCQKQAKEAVQDVNYDLDDWSKRNPGYIAGLAIATLEYKEPTDD